MSELLTIEARQTEAALRSVAILRSNEEHTIVTTDSAAAWRFVVEQVVKRGQVVRKGDVVALVRSPHANVHHAQELQMLHLMRAQLLDARKVAEKDRSRAAELSVAAAEQRLAQAQVTVDAWAAIVSGEQLRSPIDGDVVELFEGSTGVVPVARIARLDPLYAEVALPPHADRLEIGRPCEVLFGPHQHDARFVGFAPHASVEGLPLARIEVSNPDRALAIGMRVEVCISLGTRHAVFVPRASLFFTETGATALVSTPFGVTARQVTLAVALASSDSDDVEVRGLAEGERILLDPHSYQPIGVSPEPWDDLEEDDLA